MSKVQKYVDPGWPKGEGHPVTELVSHVAGANSPFGNEVQFPLPAEELGYVHPYTRINK